MTTLPQRVTPASLEVAEKNKRNERSISICLISSSANLLSPAGHKEKANVSQPKISHRRRDKKASEVWCRFQVGFFLFVLWGSSSFHCQCAKCFYFESYLYLRFQKSHNEVIIKQKCFRRLLEEENNRIMAAWNFRWQSILSGQQDRNLSSSEAVLKAGRR